MSANSGDVSWQDAEDALIAAVEYLAVLPDRDRGFLSAGSRSCWPEIVRERWEYADAEAQPSPALTRRRVAFVERILLGERAAALAVPEAHRRLVGRVVTWKRWPGPDGFGWERVWEAEGGRASGTTSDALRKRYERAVGKVAVRMSVLGIALEAAG